ncbi:cobaltochelatase CobT-related protein [Parasphingorhabdus sp. NYA22]
MTFYWLLIGFGVAPLIYQYVFKRYFGSRPVKDLPEGSAYRVYTDRFDTILDAKHYPEFLHARSEPNANYVAEAIDERPIRQGDWQELVNECDDLFKALSGKWLSLEADIDMLKSQAHDTAITLLIDQSGSLLGDKILHLAAATKWLAHEFEKRDIAFEILGFTTSMWKGGQSRKQWLADGRPEYPGRLNDLLHIVYKPFDDTLSEDAIRTMAHPQLLRENVDGEAIQWAADRLESRKEDGKILVIVSDGAPVDDSTLVQNGPSFMVRHLSAVRDAIADAGSIQLGGVGIGYDVGQYYAVSESDKDLTKIPKRIIEVCKALALHAGK